MGRDYCDGVLCEARSDRSRHDFSTPFVRGSARSLRNKVKELFTRESAERLLLFLAVAGPLFGFVIGTMVGAHERCALPKALAGALLGGLLTAAYAMWRVFEAITGALGIDSVANLVVEPVVFALVGVGIGIAAHGISALLKKRA